MPLMARGKNEIKKLKCYPFRKRMTADEISVFTVEQFLNIITGGV